MSKVCFAGFCLVFLFAATNVRSQVTLLAENFNGGGTPAGWSKTNNSTGGDPAEADWTLRGNGYTYSSFIGDIEFHSNDNTQFYLTNSDAQVGDITETILQAPAINTTGYSFVSLQFYHHFREYQLDTGYVEVSTNGTTWTTVTKVYADDEDSVGAANAFALKIVNLNAYANNSSVYIRFRYYALFGYYWAIDNVTILGSVSSPLPVSLFTFSGYKEGNHNILKWSTVSEQNNKGFQLERSTDGVAFTSIGFISSQAASGNSSSLLNYTFTDNNPSGDKQYYRLRQSDFNGNEKLSNIVLIKGIQPKEFVIDAVFPNPVSATLNVFVNVPRHDDVMLQVIDMNGKTLKQKITVAEKGSNTLQVDVSSLVNGAYILRIISSGGEAVVTRFIKQ